MTDLVFILCFLGHVTLQHFGELFGTTTLLKLMIYGAKVR